LRANPQFDSAALSSRFRMTFDGQGQYEVDGQNYVQDRDRPRGNFESVSDKYFSTLGLQILEGRDFTADDADAKQPVAIVNASFARKYYGHESPIGRRIRIYNPAQPQPWRIIVGVVPDTLMQGPFDQQTDTVGFYMPLLGADPATQFCTIVVRPKPGQRADTLGLALSKAVAELDSNLPTYFPGTPARLHSEILGANRIIATLFGIFGMVAFILSAVGLYGVMSFSVNQRTQEFGIRMALGADAARCGWGRAASGRSRRRGLAKHPLQSEHARSIHLLCGSGSPQRGRRSLVLRSCSPCHPRRSDCRSSLRMNELG